MKNLLITLKENWRFIFVCICLVLAVYLMFLGYLELEKFRILAESQNELLIKIFEENLQLKKDLFGLKEKATNLEAASSNYVTTGQVLNLYIFGVLLGIAFFVELYVK